MTPMKIRARFQTPNNLKGSPVKCAIAVCLLFGMCCSAAAHPKKTSQRHLAPFLGSSKSTVLISPTGARILRDPTVQGVFALNMMSLPLMMIHQSSEAVDSRRQMMAWKCLSSTKAFVPRCERRRSMD